jgi:hypothetical protein
VSGHGFRVGGRRVAGQELQELGIGLDRLAEYATAPTQPASEDVVTRPHDQPLADFQDHEWQCNGDHPTRSGCASFFGPSNRPIGFNPTVRKPDTTAAARRRGQSSRCGMPCTTAWIP